MQFNQCDRVCEEIRDCKWTLKKFVKPDQNNALSWQWIAFKVNLNAHSSCANSYLHWIVYWKSCTKGHVSIFFKHLHNKQFVNIFSISSYLKCVASDVRLLVKQDWKVRQRVRPRVRLKVWPIVQPKSRPTRVRPKVWPREFDCLRSNLKNMNHCSPNPFSVKFWTSEFYDFSIW